MKPHGAPSVSADEMRAAKLSWVPGVTIDEACERFGVKRTAVSRARKAPETKPSLAELALAALTENGTRDRGTTGDLAGVASWISYVDHADSSAAEIRQLLAPMVTDGQLALDAKTWRLLRPWP